MIFRVMFGAVVLVGYLGVFALIAKCLARGGR
jgi:hypothetical protein